jgi:hypothetical protein
MHGYSDRIHHARTYLAKHYHPQAPDERRLPFVAQPYNVLVILARHGADETTLVAAVLHHLIEVTPAAGRTRIEAALRSKFGPVVASVAGDAAAPRVDPAGTPLAWRHRKREVLRQLGAIEPRALDIRCAAEIHECGSAISLVGRLGPEYLEPHGHGPRHETLDWYDDLLQALGRRIDWPSVAMQVELADLVGQLRDLVGPRRPIL